ncbi:MAG: helix-turn-helix domain-containing protein [Chitinophagaceae bacterium]
MHPDPTNTIFQKAVSFVLQTNRSLFITGKAGTGKTTFLKYIKDLGYRKMAIVAPTGVAAINAGGVTIHSFFQLPIGPFIPTIKNAWGNYNGEMNNPLSLLQNLRLNKEKIKLIRELELLVIDEVSMVRADLLDAIDTVLKHVRQKPDLPFGGLQLVLIGDLFQLPPVVKNNEWDLIKEYYSSPFFFEALALKAMPPLYLELKKIYRQKDDDFIALLNNVRNNTCSSSDLEFLHRYYRPGFIPQKGDNYITLSSHNEKADRINQRELEQLPGRIFTFEATIEGAFYENSFPAEKTLFLKSGAQIMFIKNDTGEDRRYFNGKIGLIKSINNESIFITFPNGDPDLELERETWENIKYNYNKESDKIEEDKQGSFIQYPIRLAWAITIHKSQGLTFEKAIIDAGSSFAAGQVYVSLSRLTGLDGLVLYSRIEPGCITTDLRVLRYIQNEIAEEDLDNILEVEQRKYVHQSIVQGFTWEKLVETMENHLEAYAHRQMLNKADLVARSIRLQETVIEQAGIATKFRRQLESLLLNSGDDNFANLNTRTAAAGNFFIKEINEKFLAPLDAQLKVAKTQPRIKKYLNSLLDLQLLFERKKNLINQAMKVAEALYTSKSLPDLLEMLRQDDKSLPIISRLTIPTKEKTIKGDSGRLSLQLFKEGKSIPDIAEQRMIAISTVMQHLSAFIITGEIDITDLVPVEKLGKILAVINAEPGIFSSVYKEKLGEGFEYGEIRAVMVYRGKEKLSSAS